jgi:lysophospholipid acyltransferase (LPLAT)-like uncharacterized protein
MTALRRAAGAVLGLVAWVWLRSLRLTVVVDPALEGEASSHPWVLAFFHGSLWPLLAWKRRRPTAALVSLSADGDVFASALARVGLVVVRGSSSRGGAQGLAALVRFLRRAPRAHDAAVAVDGPRGPRGVAKDGAIRAARLARGALVVPMGSAAASATVLRSWDRFALAWPFSRAVVVLGAPVAHVDAAGADELARRISQANHEAACVLEAQRGLHRFLGAFRRCVIPVNARGGGTVQRRQGELAHERLARRLR